MKGKPVDERQRFIDACVIALFARGWPKDTLFQRAEELWRMREEYKKGKP